MSLFDLFRRRPSETAQTPPAPREGTVAQEEPVSAGHAPATTVEAGMPHQTTGTASSVPAPASSLPAEPAELAGQDGAGSQAVRTDHAASPEPAPVSALPPAVPSNVYEPRRVQSIPDERFSLEDTNRLAELMEVPRTERDARWVEDFQVAAWNASIVLPAQAGFLGPDGMPYVRMELPPPGQAVETNCLSNIFASVAEQGFGAAFFASAAEGPEMAEYVLPTGVLESLRNFGTWDGDPTDTAEILQHARAEAAREGLSQTVVETERQVLVGTPSRDFLPQHTARLLFRHLTEGWKIEEPRVAMIVDAEMAPTRSLVIGRKFSEFPDGESAARATQLLLWYLPPRRTLLLMPENWTLEQLHPLKELC